MSVKLHSFGISDVGRVRKNNEDVWAVIPDRHFFILADGMGGQKAGEVAASYALQSMCRSVDAMPCDMTVEQACPLLRRAIAAANTKVFHESRRHPAFSGMGTTLSCFMVVENSLIYAHIGDSRLYRYRSKLDRLTEDHSLRNPALAHLITSHTHRKNMITRAVGAHSVILPDLGVIPIVSKDIYLLCSDGLSDYVDEAKMHQVLSSSLSLRNMGEKLVDAALKKGGNDNITLILVQSEYE
jgi:protein phosphatase